MKIMHFIKKNLLQLLLILLNVIIVFFGAYLVEFNALFDFENITAHTVRFFLGVTAIWALILSIFAVKFWSRWKLLIGLSIVNLVVIFFVFLAADYIATNKAQAYLFSARFEKNLWMHYSPRNRGYMTHDIVQKKILIGHSRPEVGELLGKADIEGENAWYYRIGQMQTANTWIKDDYVLAIYFDIAGSAEKAYIIEDFTG